jgi:ABC-2 type transport system ATP-binding protein
MQEVRSFIRRLVAEEGKTVFLSSHLLHEVEQVCDRVLILSKGQVVAQGRVDEMLSQTYGVALRITDPSKAAAILSNLDWVSEARAEGEWVKVQAPPERAPELVAALAAHNHFPHEVRPVQATLESVFLSLTEFSNDGPAP